MRANLLRAEDGWTRFTYRTRPSAQHFCRSLIRETAARGDIEPPGKVSEWIADQSWFLYVWKLDPTIRGMLVVLDEIQSQLRSFEPPDFQEAWTRLEPGSDAIWFHFLPLPDMGDEIDLYVTMNSRGKPLTTFENLKAHLEHTLSWNEPLRRGIAKAFDIRWTDLLWEECQQGEQESLSHQTDDLDARMLRFLRFTFDTMAWEAGTSETVSSGRHALMARVEDLFGPDKGYNSVGYVTSAFDAWAVPDPGADLDDLFRRAGESPLEREQLLVFFESTDLFDACCRAYGTEDFTRAQTLMLYAEMLFRTRRSESPRHQVLGAMRVLRNLLEHTNLDRNEMPAYVREVRRLVLDGELPTSAFSGAQRRDELRKRDLLAGNPDDSDLEQALFGLEDHRLLRGSLAAIDFGDNSGAFMRRAETFQQVFSGGEDWLAISGALIAHSPPLASPEDCGWASSANHKQYPPVAEQADGAWRTFLTSNNDSDRLAPTRAVLAALLDAAAMTDNVAGYPAAAAAGWTHEGDGFDARYYFMKYPLMRENTSGIFHMGTHGFSVRRLRPGQRHQASRQHDPYLLAIKDAVGVELAEQLGDPGAVWWVTIWMRIGVDRGLSIKSHADGLVLRAPADVKIDVPTDYRESGVTLSRLGEDLDTYPGVHYLLAIPRAGEDRLDAIDRVVVGAAWVRELLEQAP